MKNLKYILFGILGATTLFVALTVGGPNQDLHFTREVISEISPERLDRHVSSLTRWPMWFFSLAEVHPIQDPTQRTLKVGEILKLSIDPQKGQRKKFEITAQVTEYEPGKKLSLTVLQDSSGRLTRLFDHLTWSIEFNNHPKGSLIRGEVTAHTSHWRSRIFGRIAEKILLNQVFYPNLVKLAQLRQPFSLEPPQNYGMGTP